MTISTSATRGSSVLIRDIRNSGSCSSFFMANQIRQDRSCRALHSDSSHLQESKMALFGAGFIQCVHRHFLSPSGDECAHPPPWLRGLDAHPFDRATPVGEAQFSECPHLEGV